MVDSTDNTNQNTASNAAAGATESPNASTASASNTANVDGSISGTAGASNADTAQGTSTAGQPSPNAPAIAANTAVAPLTEAHKETLLQRIEDLPEEIVAWVKAHF